MEGASAPTPRALCSTRGTKVQPGSCPGLESSSRAEPNMGGGPGRKPRLLSKASAWEETHSDDIWSQSAQAAAQPSLRALQWGRPRVPYPFPALLEVQCALSRHRLNNPAWLLMPILIHHDPVRHYSVISPAHWTSPPPPCVSTKVYASFLPC